MHFASDNWAGVHPAIAARLSEQAEGFATPYGVSSYDSEIERRFNEIFERDVAVFFVATGTAANSLALTLVAKPGGLVFAHRDAHMVVDECGAPEYLSGQLRFVAIDGPIGKMDAARLRSKIEHLGDSDLYGGRPNAISVTQATEAGTLYSLAELDAVADVAAEFNLPLHMDGARFANAIASLGCTPAEMTWKRGVDMLSFGGTKNGCWCAEAVVLFDTAKARDFAFVRKRAAQLFSKSRFVSAQFDAYFHDGLWLKIASQSNSMAAQVAKIIAESSSARLAWKPQSNEVFAIISKTMVAALKTRGVVFYDWPAPSDVEISEGEQLCRFVTCSATTAEDIRGFSQIYKELPWSFNTGVPKNTLRNGESSWLGVRREE